MGEWKTVFDGEVEERPVMVKIYNRGDRLHGRRPETALTLPAPCEFLFPPPFAVRGGNRRDETSFLPRRLVLMSHTSSE
jgi:hypothetical protein